MFLFYFFNVFYIQKGSFIIHLHIISYNLNIINILSNQLQNKKGTLGQSADLIQSVIKTFEDSRNSEVRLYTTLLEKIVTFSEEYDIKLEVPSRSNEKFCFK